MTAARTGSPTDGAAGADGCALGPRQSQGWPASAANDSDAEATISCRSRFAGPAYDRARAIHTGLRLPSAFTGAIAKEILHELRLVYFTPALAKEAGFLETEHFGVLFPHRMSHFDLTGIPQRWLRDRTWDFIADLLRSPRCPRTASPIDGFRRAAVELGVFLELEASGGRARAPNG